MTNEDLKQLLYVQWPDDIWRGKLYAPSAGNSLGCLVSNSYSATRINVIATQYITRQIACILMTAILKMDCYLFSAASIHSPCVHEGFIWSQAFVFFDCVSFRSWLKETSYETFNETYFITHRVRNNHAHKTCMWTGANITSSPSMHCLHHADGIVA